MSEEQLKAFLEKVKSDTSLQEKLNAATEVDDVIAIAKEAGFMISAEVLKKDQPHIEDVELRCCWRAGLCISIGARYAVYQWMCPVSTNA